MQRGAAIVRIALCAALVVALALPSAVRSKAAAQSVATHPCAPGTPNPTRIVEDPPVAPDPYHITLYAFQDGNRFCYKQHPNDAIMVLSTDRAADEATLAALRAIPGIASVRSLTV